MTNVGYNAPQYGYGAVPSQPEPPAPPAYAPQPVAGEPADDHDSTDGPAPAVASYDVDPAPGHAPPLLVRREPVSFDKSHFAKPDLPADDVEEPDGPDGTPDVEEADDGEADDDVESFAAVPLPAAPAGVDPENGAVEPVTAPPATPSGRVAVQVVDRFRNTAERGTTVVPAHVMEKIATLAVREVPGVHDFPVEQPAEGDRSLSITLDDRTATVEIHLVIEYGFAVYTVTEKVRTKVISGLENLFGLDVTAVDIVIDDIHLAEAEPTP